MSEKPEQSIDDAAANGHASNGTCSSCGCSKNGDDRIALVHATNSSGNGFEMQLPLNAGTLFTAAGYTEANYAASWTTILDAFAAAFPSHAIDVEVHPVFGSDAVAEAVTAHGHMTLGERFGVFSAWWSVKNAVDVYPGMFALLGASAAQSFGAVQIVGSWVTTPERFDNDLSVYQAAYSLALGSGIDYLEVWNADLLDPSLAGFLTSVHDAVAP